MLYCFLGVIVAWLLYRQIIRSPRADEWSRIYAPARRRRCLSSTSPTLLAVLLALSLNAYVLLGGADFGGGVWDLLARGPRRARQRELIAHAIGPIWEANHVWLILAIVLPSPASRRRSRGS